MITVPGRFLIAIQLALIPLTTYSQAADSQIIRQLTTNTSFSGQWFLIYNVQESGSGYNNSFTLRRGYITFSKKFSDIFSVRFTQDIVLDEEGSDAGNIEMRLKYCLLHIENSYLPVLKNSWWEIGLINRPFFGFEDKVNDYRVQSAMFLDKYKILSSADFGVSFSGLIGGEVNQEYQKNVSSSFPGKYGSYSVGLYNGGGYHAIEANSNKLVEGRITIRPFGNSMPGFQASYSFVAGKGNVPSAPDFSLSHLYLSWQSRSLVIAGQIYKGIGNGGGTLTDEEGAPCNNRGYSVFGEMKLIPTNWALMSRIDRHHIESENPDDCSSFTTGICYRFMGSNKFLANIDTRKKNGTVTRIYEAAIEIRF